MPEAAVIPLPGVAPLTGVASSYRPAGVRVRVFNVKFSPNLGDGLLSECLEQALIDCGADAGTRSVDLAGRTGFGEGAAGRSLQLGLLDALPSPLRRQAVRLPLAVQSRRRWRPHYREALRRADCLVIGGGNLIADLDCNFPTKIALAVEEAARRGLPVFVYGCGAAGNWSRRGRALLERALDTGALRRVFMRDALSCRIWNELAGSARGLEATRVRDPGLLAAERYRPGARPERRGRPLIGINLTSPVALRYHSRLAVSQAGLDAWYLDLARSLLARGCRIAVFTNGTPEDRACVRRLRPAFAALGGQDDVGFPQAETPGELVRLIAGLDALAAFRMHAVIAAYSCAVPFLALAWDPKLEAFVQSVDRTDWLCHTGQTPGEGAAERLIAAMRKGIPDAERRQVIGEARSDIAMLHDEIARARS